MKSKLEKSIQNFRFERVQLKMLKFNDGNEQRRNINFIKGEVLDVQDKLIELYGTITDQRDQFSHI